MAAQLFKRSPSGAALAIAIASSVMVMNFVESARSDTFAPMFDVEASSSNGVDFILTDGDWTIATQYRPSSNIDRRGVLEFDLSSLPASAEVQSASLWLDVSLLSYTTGNYPVLRLYGYAGNGVPNVSDATQQVNLIGLSDPVDELALIEIQLDPVAVQPLMEVSDYLGIMAFGSENGYQLGFSTLESAAYSDPPSLTLTYVLAFGLGDYSGDDVTNLLDINPFLMAMVDPTTYAATYPHVVLADIDPNGDGVPTLLGINPFVTLVVASGGGSSVPVPEPSVMATFLFMIVLAAPLHRRPGWPSLHVANCPVEKLAQAAR